MGMGENHLARAVSRPRWPGPPVQSLPSAASALPLPADPGARHVET